MAAGAEPDASLGEALIARCAVEPDFFVRDMLTWALTRYPAHFTVPRLIRELGSDRPQARSQALHTLSKVRDPSAYPSITRALVRDPNDDVAQSAWRAAVVLVPELQKGRLAEELASQFGRGGRPLQLSLSRALVALGAQVTEPVLNAAMASEVPGVRAHAGATRQLLDDPNAAFELSVQEARRQYAIKDRPA